MIQGFVTIQEGALLTGFSRGHIRRLAVKGLVMGVKFGRDWIINREGLLQYKRDAEILGNQKHNPWRESLAGGRKRENRQS